MDVPTPLLDLVALSLHGTARLRGRPGEPPDRLRGLQAKVIPGHGAPEPIAVDAEGWLRWLTCRGATAVLLDHAPGKRFDFAGMGPHGAWWSLVTDAPDGSRLRWTRPEATWWGGIFLDGRPRDVPLMDLPAASACRARLLETCSSILLFTARTGRRLEDVERAAAVLEGGLPARCEPAPEGLLGPEALVLLDAALRSWCFTGMGCFADWADGRRHAALVSAHYDAVRDALLAACREPATRG